MPTMTPNPRFRAAKPGSGTSSRDEARERLKHAVEVYEQSEGSLTITQAAKLYAVSKTTLYHRINGRREQALSGLSRQRLTAEEKFIESWALLMAEELLQPKNDDKELGANWTSEFLARHPTLKSKYSRNLDQE